MLTSCPNLSIQEEPIQPLSPLTSTFIPWPSVGRRSQSLVFCKEKAGVVKFLYHDGDSCCRIHTLKTMCVHVRTQICPITAVCWCPAPHRQLFLSAPAFSAPGCTQPSRVHQSTDEDSPGSLDLAFFEGHGICTPNSTRLFQATGVSKNKDSLGGGSPPGPSVGMSPHVTIPRDKVETPSLHLMPFHFGFPFTGQREASHVAVELPSPAFSPLVPWILGQQKPRRDLWGLDSCIQETRPCRVATCPSTLPLSA